MYSNSSILIGCLQYPVVATDKMTIWHDIFRRAISQENCFHLTTLYFWRRYIVQPSIYFRKTQEVEISGINIFQIDQTKLFFFFVFVGFFLAIFVWIEWSQWSLLV